MYEPKLCLLIHRQHNTLKNNGAGDLLINPTSLIALTLPARLLSSHYLPFVFVRGQMLIPVKLSLSCRCNTSMQDLSGQTSLQKSQINTDSNIH